ncbi:MULTISPECIES: hypothetical protein [unclassified Mesorhizobium]|uniref:hypothetical protein n=1 Tax=unclassified Mesorhizobium TaxID=325217 RepID=UPI0010933DDC|nr:MULTISPECIES: hypothetical protein [unclassified Mesorhizobium]TGT91269.1 hypothetical protein EN804_08120 [Mesorhizobium sp. M8A.F.Ca.ET.161.01.1.1]TGV43452.1 hypothetical protein EN785_05430 [Mesorhizobium sp. M8A.F.Ca.ET.142.01.1.1]TGW06671.1 hypothetical protein EN788_40895 [Mesorhizobium sp. M2D.F.Ca.ET.145.01.1.1]
MAEKTKPPQIAILAWGSLIWDDRWPSFDDQREDWLEDGPVLPLEFSRVSKTRKGALTLVIDRDNGSECKVMYAISRRKNPADAIADLRDREGTIMDHMGFYYAKEPERKCVPAIPAAIRAWAKKKKFDVVVWAGMPSNFSAKNAVKRGEAFSIDTAVAHLQKITPEGKAAAATYVWRAPGLVVTKLRTRLQAEPWFPAPKDIA